MTRLKFYATADLPGRTFTAEQIRALCGVARTTPLVPYVRYGIKLGRKYVITEVPAAVVASIPKPPPVPDVDPPPTRKRTPAVWCKPVHPAAVIDMRFRMAHETIDDLMPVNGQRIAAAPDPDPKR